MTSELLESDKQITKENITPSGPFFDNLKSEKKVDEKPKGKFINSISFLVDKVFNRLEKICVILWGEYLNEEDVALLLRLSDPSGKGKETIRNYALRSKKLSFAKAGRNGLLIHRKDIEKLYQNLRTESFREL